MRLWLTPDAVDISAIADEADVREVWWCARHDIGMPTSYTKCEIGAYWSEGCEMVPTLLARIGQGAEPGGDQ